MNMMFAVAVFWVHTCTKMEPKLSDSDLKRMKGELRSLQGELVKYFDDSQMKRISKMRAGAIGHQIFSFIPAMKDKKHFLSPN